MENKTGLILSYVFLILIIFGLAGYIVYDKDFFNLKKVNEKELETKNDQVKLNYNTLYQIGNTLESFDTAFNEDNTDFTAYIYNDKKIFASKFDRKAALYAALRKELIKSGTNQSLANGTVKNNYDNIFGNYLSYEPSIIQAGNNYNIYFDNNSRSYYYTIPATNNLYLPKYFTVTTKTEAIKEDIVVTRKLFYVSYAGSEAIIYKDSSQKEEVAKVALREGIVNEKEVIDKYSLKLKTFKYTFKRRKDADYSFYSIERIKWFFLFLWNKWKNNLK